MRVPPRPAYRSSARNPNAFRTPESSHTARLHPWDCSQAPRQPVGWSHRPVGRRRCERRDRAPAGGGCRTGSGRRRVEHRLPRGDRIRRTDRPQRRRPSPTDHPGAPSSRTRTARGQQENPSCRGRRSRGRVALADQRRSYRPLARSPATASAGDTLTRHASAGGCRISPAVWHIPP